MAVGTELETPRLNQPARSEGQQLEWDHGQSVVWIHQEQRVLDRLLWGVWVDKVLLDQG